MKIDQSIECFGANEYEDHITDIGIVESLIVASSRNGKICGFDRTTYEMRFQLN